MKIRSLASYVSQHPIRNMLIGVVCISAFANLVYRFPNVYVMTENSSGKVAYWSFDYDKMVDEFAIYNAKDENGIKGHKYYRWKETKIFGSWAK